MGIFTEEAKTKLTENGNLHARMQKAGQSEPDFMPVVRVFILGGSASWLLTEIDPDYPDIAFGLCDLGHGFPELGSVSMAELEQVKATQNLLVQQDEEFVANYPLSIYAQAASRAAKITLEEDALMLAAGDKRDES